jgi:hypothetical protein
MTGKRYNLEDYPTPEYFLNEYNGSSHPSFMSGCGMFHDTYNND